MTRDKDQVVKRVQALLRLGESTNPHEAALAAQKAQELMLQHNIDFADLADNELGPEEFGVDFYYIASLHVSSGAIAADINWKRLLLTAAAHSLLCEVIGYGRLVGKHAIVGQPSNVKVVKYLYEYLASEITRLADLAWTESDANISSGIPDVDRQRYLNWIVSFKLGAVQSVYMRLQEQYAKTTQASDTAYSIITGLEAQREEAVRRHFGELPTEDPQVRAQASAFEAGQQAGQNIPINSAVTTDQAAGIPRELPG
jgi:hypothetical protein